MNKDEAIHLVPYNPQWKSKFEDEKNVIEKILRAWVNEGIHHVGSTSIPGLAAKPIIDIMVGVESLAQSKECIELLAQIDYCYAPYRTNIMHWFCKPSPEHRTHHLYLMEPTNPEWKARLAFRNYLRDNASARMEYETLKLRLSKKHKFDREAYTAAKTEFVARIVKIALISS